MTTTELLQKIIAHEQAEHDRLTGPKPPEPPALVPEKSETFIVSTAFGGWWGYRRYADGTTSKAQWRGYPAPKRINEKEYYSAVRLREDWETKRWYTWPEVRLISGGARGWFNGNQTGRCSRSLPPATVEEIFAHYGDRLNNPDMLSRSGKYAAELIAAGKKIGAI